jgi:hypothetical protein
MKMKTISHLCILLISITCLSACEEACQEYTAFDMVGTYQNGSGVFMYVTSITSSRIRIDDHFTGTITECGEIDVIEQTYQHPITNSDITVSGTARFEIDDVVLNSGQTVAGGKKFVTNLTYLTQGQTVVDQSTYHFQ